MTRVLVLLALLGSGLGSGVMFSTVIGVAPMTLVLPYERYVETIRFLWPRYDPFMPITHVVTFACDVALLFLAPDGRVFFGIAAGLLAIVMIISVVKNVPINRYVTSLDPHDPPPDWADRDPRVKWRNWNLIRTGLALLALGANLCAVAVLV